MGVALRIYGYTTTVLEMLEYEVIAEVETRRPVA